ncbi:hypothetical protein AB0F16_16815 [Streptomyces tanashiensis]|uniref:hypothetical protein n=1 Tax=Streptomyces tanashiensis TaxID=67367 RepID=UPI0033CB2661
MLALAPAYNVVTEDMTAYEITDTPLAAIRGTCDGQVGREALSFAADATAGSSAGFHSFEMRGANHDYFNTHWSPESGESPPATTPAAPASAPNPVAPPSRPS